jgi:hypothetical protein
MPVAFEPVVILKWCGMAFSDYIVYVDESGDHSLTSIDPHFPVFVLSFCVVCKSTYINSIVPEFQRLKFNFWGHDGIVLHGQEIRKEKGDFHILRVAETRESFLDQLNSVIKKAEFMIVAAVIDKKRHVEKYAAPADPYEIAFVFCLERLQRYLINHGQAERTTHVQVECRGKAEDAKLELEFRRIAPERTLSAKCRISTSASWTRNTILRGYSLPTWLQNRLGATSSIRISRIAPMTSWSPSSGGGPGAGSMASG